MKNLSDLLGLNDRKRDASTNGGEWHGPCPVCGGTDRCSYWPHHPKGRGGRWHCRRCHRGGDAIDYLMAIGHTFADAWREINGDAHLPSRSAGPVRPAPTTRIAPPESWQVEARVLVDGCSAALLTPAGRDALAYLRGRGLTDATIRAARLGFNARAQRLPGHTDAWLPAGVTIPAEVDGTLWSVKVRRLPTQRLRCPNRKCAEWRTGPGECPKCGAKVARYMQLARSVPALFNADSVTGSRLAVWCAGEFDAILLGQLAQGLGVATITWGSETSLTNAYDLVPFARQLAQVKAGLIVLDRDQAGTKGAVNLAGILGRFRVAVLPEGVGKDVTDLHLAGVDLRAWLKRESFTSDNRPSTPDNARSASTASLGVVEGRSASGGHLSTSEPYPAPSGGTDRVPTPYLSPLEASRAAWALIESLPGFRPGEGIADQPNDIEAAYYAAFARLSGVDHTQPAQAVA